MEEYTLKNLTTEDLFPMCNIVAKIGLKEFRTAFEQADVKEAISKAAKGDKSATESIGVVVALDMFSIIMANISKAKLDIYNLLAELSGMDQKAIAELAPATFAQMIIDVIKKPEFNDFFQVVYKLIK